MKLSTCEKKTLNTFNKLSIKSIQFTNNSILDKGVKKFTTKSAILTTRGTAMYRRVPLFFTASYIKMTL